MRGTLHNTSKGWVVVYRDSDNIKTYPLHLSNLGKHNEGSDVEFYLVNTHSFIEGEDPQGIEHAILKNNWDGFECDRLDCPHCNYDEDMKDWDITLMDGIEDENIFEGRAEQIALEEFKNVGDEGLFPNHTDKDIWIAGFKAGLMYDLKNV